MREISRCGTYLTLQLSSHGVTQEVAHPETFKWGRSAKIQVYLEVFLWHDKCLLLRLSQTPG